MHVSVGQLVDWSVSLSVFLFVCLYVCLSVCLSVTPFAVTMQEVPVCEDFRKQFNSIYLELGGMGERVLGFVIRDSSLIPRFSSAHQVEPGNETIA